MRKLFVFVALFLSASPSLAQVKLPDEIRVKQGRLTRIEAVSPSAVKWLNLHDGIDLIPDTSGKFAFILGVEPGRYKIAAFTGDKDGPSDPAFCSVIVEGTKPGPPPPPPPDKKTDPTAATVRIMFGNSGCTATIIAPRRTDGRWNILTAAHCTGSLGAKGVMILKDSRKIPVTVTVRQTVADITWMVTDPANEDLPSAELALVQPAVGTAIWHTGYGIDKPANKETGRILSAQDSNGQLKIHLSVSPGDSGGGIFRTDTGQLVAVVCCTSSMARPGAMWGGSSVTAAKLRPLPTYSFADLDNWIPALLPERADN